MYPAARSFASICSTIDSPSPPAPCEVARAAAPPPAAALLLEGGTTTMTNLCVAPGMRSLSMASSAGPLLMYWCDVVALRFFGLWLFSMAAWNPSGLRNVAVTGMTKKSSSEDICGAPGRHACA